MILGYSELDIGRFLTLLFTVLVGLMHVGYGIVSWFFGWDRNKKVRASYQQTKQTVLVFFNGFSFALCMLWAMRPAIFAPLDVSAHFHGVQDILLVGATIVSIFAVWLLARSHTDLGKYWSPVLEIREGHRLITTGVYTHIRHPIYTSIFLLLVSLFFLSFNLVTLVVLVSFSMLYHFRVDDEEKMMIREFGAQYQEYMRKTKRIIPGLL